MIAFTSSADAATRRQFTQAPTGMQLHYTGFIGPEGRDVGQAGNPSQPDAAALEPMAFLIEQVPHSCGRPHFHCVDQWQVFVQGEGTLGRHPISDVYLHFAGAFTTYGPIKAGEKGVSYFTLRNAFDFGAHYMPDERERLRASLPNARREEKAGPEPAMTLEALAQLKRADPRAVIGPEPDGLGAWRIAVPPLATATGPDPRSGRGQSYVVLAGQMIFEGKTLPTRSCLFVHPDDGSLEIVAGPEGVEVLCLQYPRQDGEPASR